MLSQEEGVELVQDCQEFKRITDMYHPNSVKAVEKLGRGSTVQFIVKGKHQKAKGMEVLSDKR